MDLPLSRQATAITESDRGDDSEVTKLWASIQSCTLSRRAGKTNSQYLSPSVSALRREAFTHSMLCEPESFGACSLLVSSIYQSLIVLCSLVTIEGLPSQTGG